MNSISTTTVSNLMVKPVESIETLCEKYLQSLTEKEYKAYCIAKSHLGSSFQLEKSNGFLKWKSSITMT